MFRFSSQTLRRVLSSKVLPRPVVMAAGGGAVAALTFCLWNQQEALFPLHYGTMIGLTTERTGLEEEDISETPSSPPNQSASQSSTTASARQDEISAEKRRQIDNLLPNGYSVTSTHIENMQQARQLITDEEWRAIFIQFMKQNPGGDWPSLARLQIEYERFLWLKITWPDVPLCPSREIDKMWHAHILATREYHQFCARHNKGGAYLHKDPTMPDVERRYALTKDYYDKAFGEPRRLFWPHAHSTISSRLIERISDLPGCDGKHRAHVVDPLYLWLLKQPKGYNQQELVEYYRMHANEYHKSMELNHWSRKHRLKEEQAKVEECIKEGLLCCARGHCWEKGQFDMFCEDCRETSDMSLLFKCA